MQRHADTALPARILIPWDGLTPIKQVLAFARSLGGDSTRLELLPVTEDAALPAGLDDTVTVLDRPQATSPARGIIDVAASERASLVLMATPCHPSEELDPGCLAAEIALDSPIPVMVVHFDCDDLTAFPPQIKRLLVPLDGSLRAAQAIPFAERLAHQMKLPVHLVTVIDLNRALPPAYAYDPEAAATMSAELRGEAGWVLRQAERMVSRNGVPVTSDIINGEVVPSLEAAREPGDVVIMTTHGIGTATRERLGSVAAQLVTQTTVPLVIMRSSLPADLVVAAHGDRIRYQPISRPTA